MIYVFSSLIVLAGGGILMIVWKYYGSFIKNKARSMLEGRNMPKISARMPKVRMSKPYSINPSSFKDKFKKPPPSVLADNKKKPKNKQKGVHVSSLLGEKGEQFWIEVIKSDPQNPHPYKKLGEWYLENNKDKFAIETFEYAARLDPDDAQIKEYLQNLKGSSKPA